MSSTSEWKQNLSSIVLSNVQELQDYQNEKLQTKLWDPQVVIDGPKSQKENEQRGIDDALVHADRVEDKSVFLLEEKIVSLEAEIIKLSQEKTLIESDSEQRLQALKEENERQAQEMEFLVSQSSKNLDALSKRDKKLKVIDERLNEIEHLSDMLENQSEELLEDKEMLESRVAALEDGLLRTASKTKSDLRGETNAKEFESYREAIQLLDEYKASGTSPDEEKNTSEAHSSEDEVATLNQTISCQKLEISHLNEKLEEQIFASKRLDEEYNLLKKKLTDKEKEMTNVAGVIDEIDALNAKVAEYKKQEEIFKHEKREMFKTLIEEKTNENVKLNELYHRQLNITKDLYDKISRLESRCNKLIANEVYITAEKEKHRLECIELSEETRRLFFEKKELMSSKESLTEENAKLLSTKDDLEKDKINLKMEKEQLLHEKSDLIVERDNLLEEKSNLIKQKEEVFIEKMNLSTEKEALAAQNSKLMDNENFIHSKVNEAREFMKTQKKRFEELEKEKELLAQKVKDHEKTAKEAELNLKNSFDASEEQLLKLRRKSKELKAIIMEKEELIEKHSLCEAIKKDLKNGNIRLMSKVKRQKEEISKLGKEALLRQRTKAQIKKSPIKQAKPLACSATSKAESSQEEIGPTPTSCQEVDGSSPVVLTLKECPPKRSKGMVLHKQELHFKIVLPILNANQDDAPLKRKAKVLSPPLSSRNKSLAALTGKSLSSTSKQTKRPNEESDGLRLPHKTLKGIANP